MDGLFWLNLYIPSNNLNHHILESRNLFSGWAVITIFTVPTRWYSSACRFWLRLSNLYNRGRRMSSKEAILQWMAFLRFAFLHDAQNVLKTYYFIFLILKMGKRVPFSKMLFSKMALLWWISKICFKENISNVQENPKQSYCTSLCCKMLGQQRELTKIFLNQSNWH